MPVPFVRKDCFLWISMSGLEIYLSCVLLFIFMYNKGLRLCKKCPWAEERSLLYLVKVWSSEPVFAAVMGTCRSTWTQHISGNKPRIQGGLYWKCPPCTQKIGITKWLFICKRTISHYAAADVCIMRYIPSSVQWIHASTDLLSYRTSLLRQSSVCVWM